MIPFVAQSGQNTRGRLILFEQLYGRKTIISFIADDILRGLHASHSLGSVLVIIYIHVMIKIMLLPHFYAVCRDDS